MGIPVTTEEISEFTVKVINCMSMVLLYNANEYQCEFLQFNFDNIDVHAHSEMHSDFAEETNFLQHNVAIVPEVPCFTSHVTILKVVEYY